MPVPNTFKHLCKYACISKHPLPPNQTTNHSNYIIVLRKDFQVLCAFVPEIFVCFKLIPVVIEISFNFFPDNYKLGPEITRFSATKLPENQPMCPNKLTALPRTGAHTNAAEETNSCPDSHVAEIPWQQNDHSCNRLLHWYVFRVRI